MRKKPLFMGKTDLINSAVHDILKKMTFFRKRRDAYEYAGKRV